MCVYVHGIYVYMVCIHVAVYPSVNVCVCCEPVCCLRGLCVSRDFSRFFFSRSSYDTLALHALVDDTIEKTTAVVTEGGAVVGVLLEMVLRPRVLRYYTITPCTHTQPLGLDDDENGGDGEKEETERGGARDRKGRITRLKRTHRHVDRWISQSWFQLRARDTTRFGSRDDI